MSCFIMYPLRFFRRPRLQSERFHVLLYHVYLVVSCIPVASSVDLDFNLRNSMSRCIMYPHRFLCRPRVQSEKLHVLPYHVSGTVSPSIHRFFCRPRLQSEKLHVLLYHVSPSLLLSTSTSI